MSSVPARTRRGASVLLIDDQPVIGAAIARMLAAEPATRFHHCLEPARALADAERVQPTVILLDMVMPDVDGLTLLRYLRAAPATRGVPIVVMSSRTEPAVKAEAFALGADDYVVKLPDPLELVARVRYHSRAYNTALDARDAWDAVVESQRQLEARNQFIRKTFGRYLSDEIVASLLETQGGLHLGGEARSVTILMADLRGFTSMCEQLAPAQVVALLNNYLGAMGDIVVDHGGTVDEFIGDAILAVFGAPIHHADHARRAVTCAIAMQRAMPAVNARNRAAGLVTVEMGVGLGTGEVVVGNIGSERRAKYGVVGGRVNLTSRIAGLAAGGQILASEPTVRDATDAARYSAPRDVALKGVTGAVAIYEVLGGSR
jgi:adenylate cyclase